MRTSSLENGGRKGLFNFEIRKDFYIITVSFTLRYVFEMFFCYFTNFFDLAKCESPLFIRSILGLLGLTGVLLFFPKLFLHNGIVVAKYKTV